MGLVFEAVLPPNEKILLLALADCAEHDGSEVRPSQLLMAMKTSMSDRTVRRLLKSLETSGLIVKTKAATHDRPAHYRIDLDAVRGLSLSPENLAKLERVGADKVSTLWVDKSDEGWTSETGRVDTSVLRPVRTTPVLEKKQEGKPTNGIVLTDDAFLASLKRNPAYEGIDIDRELGKLDAWLSTPRGRGKQKTRQRIVNWLNRADRPMAASSSPAPPHLGYLNLGRNGEILS